MEPESGPHWDIPLSACQNRPPFSLSLRKMSPFDPDNCLPQQPKNKKWLFSLGILTVKDHTMMNNQLCVSFYSMVSALATMMSPSVILCLPFLSFIQSLSFRLLVQLNEFEYITLGSGRMCLAFFAIF